MDLFSFLRREHLRLRDIMQQIEEFSPSGLKVRERLFERLCIPFLNHLRTEEQVIFSALGADRDCQDSVFKAQEQHHLLDLVLGELIQLPMSNYRWVPKFRVFRELAEHHFDCEENELFMDALESVPEEHLERLHRELGLKMGSLGDSAALYS
ncbi:MAG: hemerythrin domain-containing protein [Chitinispirillaceae bacterium]